MRKNFGGIERDGGSRDGGGSWVQGNLGGRSRREGTEGGGGRCKYLEIIIRL